MDRFRFNAKRAALVQSRIKAIERLADVDTVASDPGACHLQAACIRRSLCSVHLLFYACCLAGLA